MQCYVVILIITLFKNLQYIICITRDIYTFSYIIHVYTLTKLNRSKFHVTFSGLSALADIEINRQYYSSLFGELIFVFAGVCN